MQAVDIAYAAGFFDGEGNIDVRRGQGSSAGLRLTVNVSQNERQPLDWLRTLFGGRVYRTNKGTCHRWTIAGEEAYRFLDVIRPFLMVKEAEANEACDRWLNRRREWRFTRDSV